MLCHRLLFTLLVGECPILAGSPPVSTTPTVVDPTEDNEDTDLVPEN